MEGCATAVTETLVLPAQPVSGSVQRIPLGGDGFYAPQFAYQIKTFSLTGDATGTSLTHVVKMDERYCALIAYVTVRINQATAAAADVMFQVGGAGVPDFAEQGPVTEISATVNSGTIRKTWVPPPIILPYGGEPTLTMKVLNVDTDVVQLHAQIYAFDARVRELTPMGPLLWARGSS